MDEGGPSVPSVSLGRSREPKMRGQSVAQAPGNGHGAQEKGQRNLGASGGWLGSVMPGSEGKALENSWVWVCVYSGWDR